MAEIVLPMAFFVCRLFECSNHTVVQTLDKVVNKNTAEIKRYPAFSSPWRRKCRIWLFVLEMAERPFPLAVFRQIFFVLLIHAWHGSIVQKRFGTMSQRRGKETTINRRAHDR
jgi:hypothetical protein